MVSDSKSLTLRKRKRLRISFTRQRIPLSLYLFFYLVKESNCSKARKLVYKKIVGVLLILSEKYLIEISGCCRVCWHVYIRNQVRQLSVLGSGDYSCLEYHSDWIKYLCTLIDLIRSFSETFTPFLTTREQC